MRVRSLAAIAALAVALSALAGCNADGTLKLPSGVVYPSIKPIAGTPNTTVDQTFSFEGKPASVMVTIDGAVLVGAQHAEKAVIRFGKTRENDWIKDYYPAFAFEKHQDAFFSALLAQFRSIRDARGLDSDRYVELMAVYAQSLEYKIDPKNLSPKFPIETAAGRSGDCDDKSLLLGGLLAREGYDVAILLFGPEQHVALGIRTDGPDYRGTGYAYIETTTQGFVGMPPESVGNGIPLASAPQVFKLGDGTRTYTASAQVAEILATVDASGKRATELEAKIAASSASLKALETSVRDLKSRMDALLAAGDSAAYNALVPTYNAAATKYNAASDAHNALVAEQNRAADVHNYVLKHLDDRAGVYTYLKSHPF